jgi:hypothetical protein
MSYIAQQRQRGALQPGDILVVIRMSRYFACTIDSNADSSTPDDFDARSPDELTLRKSDQVELVELDEGFGDGWYLGRHLGQSTTGLFPGGKKLHSPRPSPCLIYRQSTLRSFLRTSLLLALPTPDMLSLRITFPMVPMPMLRSQQYQKTSRLHVAR